MYFVLMTGLLGLIGSAIGMLTSLIVKPVDTAFLIFRSFFRLGVLSVIGIIIGWTFI